jgi:hypothetical protein
MDGLFRYEVTIVKTSEAVLRGLIMTERDALEALGRVQVEPTVADHSVVVGYFCDKRDYAHEHAASVLWLAVNEPSVVMSAAGRVAETAAPAEHASLRQHWRHRLEDPDSPESVLVNAYEFCRNDDAVQAERIISRGLHDFGDGYFWHSARMTWLCHQYRLHRNVDLLDNALASSEEASRRAPGGLGLTLLANAALIAGTAQRWDHAGRLCDAVEANHSAGSLALHIVHTVRGLIALQNDRLSLATAHLVASLKPPHHPVVKTYGPHLTLARALLREGFPTPVLEFLDACRRVITAAPERVDRWIAAAQSGDADALVGAELV